MITRVFMKKLAKEILRKIIPKRMIQIWKKYFFLKKKFLKKRRFLNLELHLADHCNLSCKGCSHFSPLAKEKFIDINVFRRDCKRIADLTDHHVERIRFMGGEPLLDQNKIDVLNIARENFPDTSLSLVTNGILLPQQTNEFWKTCQQKNIQIEISNYPVKINRKKINILSTEHHVKVVWLNTNVKLHWWKMKLDVNGFQDKNKNFRFCLQSNYNTNLYEGKLYPCPTIAYIHHLNHYFDEKFVVTENDYIDIYQAKSIDEIHDYLSKPVPFCKYCNIKKQEIIEWGVSKKERNEWIDEQSIL